MVENNRLSRLYVYYIGLRYGLGQGDIWPSRSSFSEFRISLMLLCYPIGQVLFGLQLGERPPVS